MSSFADLVSRRPRFGFLARRSSPPPSTVMSRALPAKLLEHCGLDTILARLPDAYKHSMFASYVAAHFVYTYGIDASPIEFFFYMRQLQ
jgi:glutamate dehydrogenase